MRNSSSDYKRITFGFAFVAFLILLFFCFNISSVEIAYAETSDDELSQKLEDNTNQILDKIDSSELDSFLSNDFNVNFFDVGEFKELVVNVLSGEYFIEYDSLTDGIVSFIKDNVNSLLSIFLVFIAIVILFELFKNISPEKHIDFKKIISVIFSLVITFLILVMLKSVSEFISETIEKIFSFAKVIFPILLELIMLSGATGTFSVYSGLSVFLLNTGMYVFVYFLMPLSISIFVLSLFGSSFSNKRLMKLVDIFKSIFKYTITIFFGIFGLFSTVNLFTSGMKDGLSLKLTKYAIKNYIPVLGGYVSDGFDFVRSCSVLIKNAFGICGVLVLLFIVLKPIITYFVYMLMFKILSLVVSYIGSNCYSDMFETASNCMSYFIAVLIGVFLIFFVFIFLLVMSVSVV